MTWTRLDDTWSDQASLSEVDFAVRWHYLAMIQFCCRNDIRTGLMRRVDALRCSDVPDPQRAISALAAVGKLELVGETGVRVLDIAEHVPPEWVVRKQQRDKVNQRRARAHKAGDHSLCIFGSGCALAPRPADSHDDSQRDSQDDSRDGTGRDGTGNYTGGAQVEPVWNVTPIGKVAGE